jgi:signal transduction histidine kinase
VFQRLGARPDALRARQIVHRATTRPEHPPLASARFQMLMDALNDLARAVEITRVPSLVLDRMLELAGLERGAWIDHSHEGALKVAVSRNFTHGGDAASERAVALVDRARASRMTVYEVAHEGDRVVCCVAVPLVVRGRVHALLYADGAREPWAEAERPLLDALALHAAAALERGQTLEVHRRRADLLPTLCHEVNSPLAAMLGFVSLLQREEPAIRAEGRAHLDTMAGQIERLGRMVRNVLQLYRAGGSSQRGTLKPVDIRELVRDTVRFLTPLAEQRNVSLVAHTERDVGSVLGDHDALMQTLTNLIDNATRYHAGREPVRVSVTRATVPHAAHGESGWHPPARPAEVVEVRVSDRGRGIAPDEAERVFEPFHQSGTHRGAAGLGLAITREIVTAHGGTIRVESEPGLGTTVCIQLPCATPS